MPFSNTRNRRIRARETEKTLGVVGRGSVARLPSRPDLITAQEMRTMMIPSLQVRKQRYTVQKPLSQTGFLAGGEDRHTQGWT